MTTTEQSSKPFPGPFSGNPEGSELFTFINSATTGVAIKTGIGSLRSITVGTGQAASTLTLYDGTSSGGTEIIALSTTAQFFCRPACQFLVGLYAVVTGTASVTITYC